MSSINPVTAFDPSAKAATTTASTATSSATNYQQTFMQLLATELQSQDPTQTMDPTTMVSQMVSINQLSDVAGIYSILQAGSSTPTSGGVPAVANSTQTSTNPVGAN